MKKNKPFTLRFEAMDGLFSHENGFPAGGGAKNKLLGTCLFCKNTFPFAMVHGA